MIKILGKERKKDEMGKKKRRPEGDRDFAKKRVKIDHHVVGYAF